MSGYVPRMPSLLLVLLFGCVPAPPAEDTQVAARMAEGADDPRFTDLVAWTEARMAEWQVPGAALAVVVDGQVHLVGLGVRQWGQPEPVTPDTRFRVASLSKMITGAIVAEEAAAGRLDLAAPASDVLGDLTLVAPYSFADFTLLDLVGHSSGLQSIGLPHSCDADPATLGATMAELTPDWALWAPQGELFLYSNQGYGLLGLAAERSAGVPFVDLAQARFDGAGMGTATYDWVEAYVGEHATGHTMDLTTGRPLGYRGFEERACVASFPSGGLMASARDQSALLGVLLNEGEGWMTPAAWEIFTTQGYERSETGGYGFGVSSATYRGYTGLSHHGSLGGYFAMVWALPEAGVGVAVMVNSDHLVTDPPEPWSKPTQRIMERALDTFLGLDPVERTSSVRPVEEWSRYVGFYHSDYDLGNVAITLRDNTLWYADTTMAVPLLPYSRDAFQYAVPLDDGRIAYAGVSFVDDDETGAITWVATGFGLARRR